MDDRSAVETSLPPLPVRLVQVFTSPGRLFEALARRPVWIDVTLLVVALSVIQTLVTPDDLFRQAIAAGNPDLTDEQLDNAAQFGRYAAFFAVILTPVFIAFMAGLVTVIYNVILGGESTYKHALAASSHSTVVYAIGGLITLGFAVMGGEFVNFSLALLLPSLEDGFLFHLLNGLNVFAIWMLVLLGIAVSKLYPRRSAGSAIVTLLGLYVGLAVLIASARSLG